MDELKRFSNINIKYYTAFDKLIVKCSNLLEQLEDLKKVIKILIYNIKSKEIKKGTIIIEVSNEDFSDDNIMILLNIMKFTKTSHYFNIVVKNGSDSRIEFIKDKYKGININEGI